MHSVRDLQNQSREPSICVRTRIDRAELRAVGPNTDQEEHESSLDCRRPRVIRALSRYDHVRSPRFPLYRLVLQ